MVRSALGDGDVRGNQIKGRRHVAVQGVIDRALDEAHRQRRHMRHAMGQRAGLYQQLVVGVDMVDETDAQRRVGVNEIRRQE